MFNPKGIRITDVKNWSNDLCPAIKATEKGQSYICSVAHMSMAAMAQKSRQPVIEECDAGFAKLVVPIFFKNEFIGVAGGCGLVPEDGEADTFAVTKIAGLDESRVSDLAQDLPVISRAEMDRAAQFIQERITAILAKAGASVA